MSAPHSTTERVCARPGCGVRFTPKTARRVFCSDSCRAQFSKRSVSKNPARAAAAKAPVTATAAAWEPPSGAPPPCHLAEACPACGGDLFTTGRGTLRVCMGTCHRRVTPSGVRAPYERGASAGRQVKSQRERDLEALSLARSKGVMLAQLAQLAADDRLHPESRPVVEWFAEQVRSAGTAARLDELAALLPEASIRRRHWWQGAPDAIEAGTYDDEDDQGDDEYEDYDDEQDDEPAELAAPPAIAAQQQRERATWADALAARGWRLADRDGSGTCQITGDGARCTQPIGGHPPVTDRFARSGWTCSAHYYALGSAVTSINRERGIT
jgi:hypothetical protein